jgi:hypothetical protein
MLLIMVMVLLLLMLFMAAFPSPVWAIADPDSDPSINAVYVYEDLLEDGDAGVFIDYYLDYAVPPTETATEAYMAVFVDTDGATQLQAVAPYTFQASGYERGVIWIYFTAAEVTAYSIDRAGVALYEVWLVGNPTLTWVPGPDPPKTIAGLDYWQPVGTSTSTLMTLRVLQYADILELAWLLDMITETALGHRLTAVGENYFLNVIPGLMEIAPSCFMSGEYDPTLPELDYTTTFGATLTNGTGTAAGSPITLVAGANNVNVLTVGTFTLELERGTVGTAATDVGIVTGSPVDIVYGTNTITTTGIGNIIVTVNLQDTQTDITSTVAGTGFDLTPLATIFGMSRLMFSGLVWIMVSVLVCWATYRISHRDGVYGGGSGKITLLVFDLCIIGGAVLGLLSILVAVLMFIGFGALTGYVLFFRSANV